MGRPAGLRRAGAGYGVALAATLAALFVRLQLHGLFGSRPTMILFVIPIVLAAYAGGLGPGLLATALAAAGQSFLLLAPTGSLRIGDPKDLAHLLVLVASGALISALVDLLRRTKAAQDRPTSIRLARVAWRTTAVYALVASLWILLSDRLLDALAPGSAAGLWATSKGALFVAVTAALLFSVLRRQLHGWARDVAARGKAESALAEETALRRVLVDQSRDGIIVLDEAGGVIEVNRRFAETLGYPAEELRRLHVWDWDAQWSRPEIEAMLRAVDGAGDHFETRHRRKDGTILDVEISSNAAMFGERKYIFAVCRDISERKQAEQALRESRERYRSLFENMIEGYAYCRLLYEDGRPSDFVYLDTNPAFTRLTGLTQVIGRRVSEVIPGIHQKDPSLLQTYGRVVTTGRPEQFEIYMESLKIWFSISVYSPHADHFVAVFDNVTERRRTEEGLRLQSAALEAAANAIVITDRNGAIQWINPAFTAHTGYTKAEAVGRNPRDLVKSGRHDGRFYEALWSTILAGRVWRGEVTNRRKDGSLCTEEMTITPLVDAHGDITNFIAIKQDVTQQKSLESQLLRTQRLESVGRLASGLAHDLNNMLSPALLGPALLRKAIADPDAREILDAIESSAQRGADVIRQLLMFGRGTPAVRVPLEVHALVREMIKIMRETFPKNISVHEVVPPDLPLVTGDATQLHQVLMNLCVNARDAMPDGGTLTIALQADNVDAATAQSDAQPGRYIVLTVTDTGSGIAQGDLDRIYDPFFTTKPVGEGTGLGLSTVMGIVRGHKGFIRVTSEVGRGTQFRIHLPVDTGAMPCEKDDADLSRMRGRGECVLIVDDEEGVRRITRRTLEQNAYTVMEAENGREALTLYHANRGRVRVVLTDMVMPVMDGAALIGALSREVPAPKIITASGHVAEDEWSRDPNLRTHAFLSKPFNAAALLDTVHRVLES